MKTTVNFFRTLLLAVLTLTFGACGEDSLLSELGLDGQTSTKVDGAGVVWDGSVAERFAGGSGTAEDPYQIANGAQLAKLAQDVKGGKNYARTYFVLTADIVLNDIKDWESWETTAPRNSWTPIGSYEQQFTGTLDGDGHSVSGIYINSTADFQGLVGYLYNGGTLQNLGVKASYIKGGNRVGGLCGWNYDGTVNNCYNTGKVTGSNDVGGVCGLNFGNVTNCYNTGSVTGSSQVGGVCGMNMMGSVTNCYNAGNVTGTGDHVGGVCGLNYATVTNCYNSGTVAGSSQVGGVCGGNYDATVTNCYYLDTCGAAGEGTSKTADQFKSGEVAWLLQGEQAEQIWGQNISFAPKDTYPVLGGLKVVQNGDGYANELNQNSDGFYLISNADELRLFASMVNSGNPGISAKLTADIELNNTTGWENWNESTDGLNSWTPIGSGSQPFTGTLDGDGHSVSGIYINSGTDYQGLVGVLGSGGTLQNVGVKTSYIKGGYSVGGVCGRNRGTVTNCYNSGSVTGNYAYVGGLCGQNYATVTNCYNTGKVTGRNDAGGVCGINLMDGTVTNCYNSGSVTGTGDYVGGVCGNSWGNVSNCYYLTGTAAGGINGSDVAGQAEAKTADQFKSGEVASLLGEGWGQTIGKDDYPVLDADGTKRVYAVTLYQGSDAADARYLNSNGTFPTLTGNAIALVDADSPFKTGKNIVVKDGNSYTCAELVLTDAADFYTPVLFTATKATYTRSPKVWATKGGSGSGWETLCLPFSGTLYAGDVAKQPVLTDLAGDYWLRSLTDFKTPNTLIFASGSTATAADNQIKAGVPYIIALPGNTFSGESLEGQTISVRGTNVTVTNEAQSVAAGSMFAFIGTFATKACDAASYRLNSENGTDRAGDLFVLDTNKLAPFRCRIDVTGLNIGGASTRSASGLPKELRIGQ
ncbi:hypothetical protein HF895_12545 [Bacteroides sp. AN502]|nr:hypothetical protein [Caecibacteroides pullorum]MDC6281216.1 GLUG motif-containing protein [Caecibacteroides pullorum]